MRPSPAVTHTAAAPPTSNRRQSARQARTSSTRPANYYARPFGPRGSLQGAPDSRANADNAPGFFPAITHFTDAVAALPKEVMRHISMLKEVEAKLAAPNEELKTLCETIERQPPVPRFSAEEYTQSLPNTAHNSVSGSVDGGAMQSSTVMYYEKAAEVLNDPAQSSQLTPEQLDVHRNILNFVNLQACMARSFVIQALEEKNSVLLTANKTLEKQLARLESSYPYVAGEISEEARYGSMTHWAYADKEGQKKTATTSERTRRDVAAANSLAAAAAAVHEGDMAASRSEARREAMIANKRSRQQHIDSDFDERPASKKAPAVHRGRKEATDPKIFGLGISNGASQANKRRKTEKASAPAMERSMSGALKNAAAGGASPRDTPGAESVRKRARAAPAPAPARKRSGLQTAPSPPAASSPLTAAFPAARDPTTTTSTQRPQSSRARQNSAANSIHSLPTATADTTINSVRARPSSASSNRPINGARALQQQLEQAAGRNLPESLEKITREQEAAVSEAASRLPLPASANANGNGSGGSGALNTAPPLKHEDTEPNAAPIEELDPPSTIGTTTAAAAAAAAAAPQMTTRASGRASKTATPVTASFPDVPLVRIRSTRNNREGQSSHASSESNVPLSNANQATTTAKRSHKKGAGQAAAAAAAAQAATSNKRTPQTHTTSTPSSASDDEDRANNNTGELSDGAAGGEGDEEDEVDEGGNEPRYCYCNGVSYGDMVACDNEGCEREWFHLACVGMTKAPGSKTKWFCDNCKEAMRKRPGSSRH